MTKLASWTVVLMAFVAIGTHDFRAESRGIQTGVTPPRRTPPLKRSFGNSDVIKQVKAGLGDQLVLSSIENAEHPEFDVSTEGLIALKAAGVSDHIIAAIQRAASGGQGPVEPKPMAAEAGATRSSLDREPNELVPVTKQVTVAAGTQLKLYLAKAMASDRSKTGEVLEFSVVDNFLADGETAIKRGAAAWGKLTKVTSQRLRRAGNLDFTIESVKSVDGQDIPLRAIHSVNGGHGLVTGDEAKVDAGTVFTAAVDHAVLVTVTSVPTSTNASGASGVIGAPAYSGRLPSGADDPDDPRAVHDPGIYVEVPDASQGARLVPLEPTVFAQAKTGGVLASALTYGIKKAKMKAVARGRAANLRVGDPLPTFYFYFERRGSGYADAFSGWMSGASSPNEFILARMDQKENARELIIGEFGMWGGSAGTRSEDTVDLKMERLRPGVYRVTPGTPLEFGRESCLFYAAGSQALGGGAAGKLFDFGVDVR